MTNISEYARICKDTHITGENITDFNILDTIYNLETNFDARLYSKNNEIVICFQASQGLDWINNLQILSGLLGLNGSITIPTQLEDALDLYFETKKSIQITI